MSDLLPGLIDLVSPRLREALADAVSSLEAIAEETASPVDDVFVGLLKSVLKIEDAES